MTFTYNCNSCFVHLRLFKKSTAVQWFLLLCVCVFLCALNKNFTISKKNI